MPITHNKRCNLLMKSNLAFLVQTKAQTMTPKYQKILNSAAGLEGYQRDQLFETLQMWDRNQRIRREFFGRDEGVTISEIKRRLAAKYFTSESNIEKIAYEL